MGIFFTDISVGRDREGPFEPVTAMVDTGSSYLMLPAKLLSKLGVEPNREREFTLADGRKQRLPIGNVLVRYASGMRRTTAPLYSALTSAFSWERLRFKSLG